MFVSECVGFNIPLDTLHSGHLGDVSFQAIDCTGTDSQTTTNRTYTNHKIANYNTNKLALLNNKNAQI